MARTFQRLELFGSLTVRENVELAAAAPRPRQDGARRRRAPRAWSARDVGRRAGRRLPTGRPGSSSWPGPSPPSRGSSCSTSRPRARTRARPALRPPAARQLAGDGVAILLVEHDMQFVMRTCCQVHVLDFGPMLAAGPRRDPARPHGIARAATSARPRPRDAGRPAARRCSSCVVRAGYGAIEVLHGVDLDRRRRRGHAVLGPNGAGKTTTLRCSPARSPAGGDVLSPGRRVNGARGRGPGPRRAVPRPGGPGRVPQPHGPREPADGDLHRPPPGRGRGGRLRPLPRLARAAAPAGRDAVGRRAADAGARPGPGHRPGRLLLDELSMGLAPLVVEQLYEQVAAMARSGVSVLVVEQFAGVVLGVAHRARSCCTVPSPRSACRRRSRPSCRLPTWVVEQCTRTPSASRRVHRRMCAKKVGPGDQRRPAAHPPGRRRDGGGGGFRRRLLVHLARHPQLRCSSATPSCWACWA